MDEVADERTRLNAQIADIDKRIRTVGAKVVAFGPCPPPER